jgi:hypothetical protein
MRSVYFALSYLLFSNFALSQNANVILQINGRTLNYGEVSNIYLKFEENDNSKIYRPVYYPGDLILNEEIWGIIKSDTVTNFYLHFDYYTYRRGEQNIANFEIQLNRKLLEGPYLIIDVFDFRDEKYKHWYQYLTKENYLVELTYPQSGFYVRRK